MPALIDAHGRQVDYLRLSLTDRCDLRCTYCRPKGASGASIPASWLDAGEYARLVGVFVALGVRRVRLTGGEPLTRRGIVDIVGAIGAIPGLADLSLSSNGTRLAEFAAPLYAAGVRRLNVSLDTLEPERFAAITGKDRLGAVLKGLDAARAAGMAPIKINMVATAGIRLDDVLRMVEFCFARGFILRLIEAMPMGEAGQAAGYLSLAAIEAAVAARFALAPASVAGGGPARYLGNADASLAVGFITPRSRHFCDTCNRVRLTADGALHLCLGHEDRLALGPLLRAGASDEALAAAIVAALQRKPLRHDFANPLVRLQRSMVETGG